MFSEWKNRRRQAKAKAEERFKKSRQRSEIRCAYRRIEDLPRFRGNLSEYNFVTGQSHDIIRVDGVSMFCWWTTEDVFSKPKNMEEITQNAVALIHFGISFHCSLGAEKRYMGTPVRLAPPDKEKK